MEEWSGPGAPLLIPREGRLCQTKLRLRHQARGTSAHSTHGPLWLTDSRMGPEAPRSRGGGWLCRAPRHACPGAEPLFTLPIAQWVLMLCAHKHGKQTGRGEGHRRRGEARQDSATVCSGQEPLLQPGWAYLGANGIGSLPLQSNGRLEQMPPNTVRGTPAK